MKNQIEAILFTTGITGTGVVADEQGLPVVILKPTTEEQPGTRAGLFIDTVVVPVSDISAKTAGALAWDSSSLIFVRDIGPTNPVAGSPIDACQAMTALRVKEKKLPDDCPVRKPLSIRNS